MKTQILHSNGKSNIEKKLWDKPNITDNQIEVKTIYCGICRSDIGVYGGFEKPMPLGMFGHEGLGLVTKIGKNIQDVKVGEYVSTISDPAYSEYYNSSINDYVVIPKVSKDYILQPVSCAINIIEKTLKYSNFLFNKENEILIIGSGFMTHIICQYLKNFNFKLTVIGKSNTKIFTDIGVELFDFSDLHNKKYNIVIDLSSKAENFYLIEKILNIEGLLCYAATPFKNIETNFFNNCWNCHTIILPSPRNSDFKIMMEKSRDLIFSGVIKTSNLWTKDYYIWDEYNNAFEDGLNRKKDYIRGYFTF
jgi:D-arabinose 1-dehydrogenase-like Zn-dependent alcohol dehydrogenase